MNPIFIVGPTAAGKSAVALAVAQRCGAVICSADAFQIYRRLDIGTGKPTVSEQAAAPHCLINLRDPLDTFSVADYLREAEQTLAVTPPAAPQIWVGGTGLYIRALRQGLTNAPESDPELVRQLERQPLAVLQQEIRQLDPAWSAAADLQNPRRVIRALAVVKSTGKPLSAWQREHSAPLLPRAAGIFISPPREQNRSLILTRVRQMWADGWPGEVQNLLTLSGWRDSQSARALGYLPIADYLSGKLTKQDCQEKIIRQTAQYAKRQETWFKTEQGFTVTHSAADAQRLAEKFLQGDHGEHGVCFEKILRELHDLPVKKQVKDTPLPKTKFKAEPGFTVTHSAADAQRLAEKFLQGDHGEHGVCFEKNSPRTP